MQRVGDAVDFVRDQGGIIISNLIAQGTAMGRQFAELSDDAILDGYFMDDLPELVEPNVVIVDTTNELRMIYDALGRIHGGTFSQAHINGRIRYLRIVQEAAEVVGYRRCVFQYTVDESMLVPTSEFTDGWDYGGVASLLSLDPEGLTKLGQGAVVLAGPTPSDADYAQAKAMKYNGPEDIAQRIRSSDNPALQSLPIPYSVRA